MKIRGKVELQVIAKKEQPSKDGTKMYKRMGVMTNDLEVGMLRCNEDIYKSVEAGKKYVFVTCFNDDYDSFSLESVVTVGK